MDINWRTWYPFHNTSVSLHDLNYSYSGAIVVLLTVKLTIYQVLLI